MTTKEWLYHELEALDRFELMALLEDYAMASTTRGVENLAEYVDDWHKHSQVEFMNTDKSKGKTDWWSLSVLTICIIIMLYDIFRGQMFKIKKTFEVAIAHKLKLPYESKCSKFHGHNLLITVYCAAEELDENDMVVDFTHIKKRIHDVIDHSSLSDVDCQECGNRVIHASIPEHSNPTAERLAFWICMEIGACYRVDVQESEGNTASYIEESMMEV